MGIYQARSRFNSLLRQFRSGIDVGLYRQGTNLIPIVVRLPDEERLSIDSIHDVQTVE